MPALNRKNRLKRIGIVVFPAVLDGILRKLSLQNLNWQIPFCNTSWREVDFSVIKSLQLDGLIASVNSQEQADELKSLGLRVINISSHYREGISNISPDFVAAGKMIAEYIIGLGRKNVYIGGPPAMMANASRFTSFIKELQSEGIECKEINCITQKQILLVDGEWRGYESIVGELEKVSLPCTVFAYNDCVAYDVLQAARHMGLRVPEDIAVLGFDNKELYCLTSFPNISSFDPDFETVGVQAVELMEKLLSSDSVCDESYQIRPRGIVQRGSTNLQFLEFPIIREALNFINQETHNGINASDVVEALPISRRPLEKRFKTVLGKTILEVINESRIKLAEKLLEETEFPLNIISAQSGFPNPRRFTQTFKSYHGLTPLDFRLNIIKNKFS